MNEWEATMLLHIFVRVANHEEVRGVAEMPLPLVIIAVFALCRIAG